jgi:hypothetical protein
VEETNSLAVSIPLLFLTSRPLLVWIRCARPRGQGESAVFLLAVCLVLAMRNAAEDWSDGSRRRLLEAQMHLKRICWKSRDV